MKVFALPEQSRTIVILCIITQIYIIYSLSNRPHRSLWLVLAGFFIGGFITDLISGLFHFSFDYLWPPNFPIMGPIAVQFRQHHEEPTLDPSAVVTNLTKGAYGALPLALITWAVARLWPDSSLSFLVVVSLMETSLWMLGFHQIHSYAHMGSQLSSEDFNRAVAKISKLPAKQQKEEFAKLFQSLGMPKVVRVLQRSRLFLRPEIHWKHHLSFESDFSSVNGWSDPLMNLVYRPLARRKLAQKSLELGVTATTTEGS